MSNAAWLWGAVAQDGTCAILSPDGFTWLGTMLDAVVDATLSGRRVLLYESSGMRLAISALVARGMSPDVGIRTASGAVELSSIKQPGAASWLDGLTLLPAELPEVARWLSVAVPGAARDLSGAIECALAWSSIGAAVLARLGALAEVAPRGSVASTAAAAAIPRSWRRASSALARSEPWSMLREAYYGGRIELYRPGWTGDAVEYDLRSAYGWAMTQWMPDPQCYERKPLRHEPGWYDVTVRIDAPHAGPVPVRVDANRGRNRERYRITWPREGEHRGVWTREDLERSGLQVLTVHRALAGRWSDDLRRPVERWLELRERTSCALDRAILRGLSNGLAGKLAQRATEWQLWIPSDTVAGRYPPDGAVPLGLDCPVFAIPTVPLYMPVQCPQAATYVTALVRSRVWERVSVGDVIYTDTDSLHLPASAPAPARVGDAAGDWQVKATGAAHYRGVRDYSIGNKHLRAH